jgi:D-arabinan exo alpha-(1,3)/(1,5)-arabinofuranosidase (non-reducing end)
MTSGDLSAFRATSLGNAFLISDAETRSICAENPDGSRGGGAKVDPKGEGPARELSKGWKVRPCISLAAGETATLAEIDGPGIVQHIWITVHPDAYRDCILRMYWDGQASPSVEVPLGDFFCTGHGVRCTVSSLPIAVNPSGGFNSYWPMPFRKSARITIENQRLEEIRGFFYQITYALTEVPDETACFHAQWRRSQTTREHPEHVILDGVKGRGQYVGTYLAWTQMSDGWWGEGEVKFYLDGDTEHPTICGTGTEDYFGGAWNFGGGNHVGDNCPETFSTAFLGYPQVLRQRGQVPKHGLYRWHVMDPIRFREELRVTVQALGWWTHGQYEPLTDDVASTAYWYQTLPTPEFPAMLSRNLRLTR